MSDNDQIMAYLKQKNRSIVLHSALSNILALDRHT